jgi:hypothetical protein
MIQRFYWVPIFARTSVLKRREHNAGGNDVGWERWADEMGNICLHGNIENPW